MTPVVYRITNENSGRFYIGSTKDFNDRVKSHTAQFIGKAHHNKQMQEDYNKGDSFKFDVLFILDTREDAFEYEESLLNKFRGNALLYNIGRNARGGDNITDNPRREAIIEQMRRSIIERYAKMSAAERKLVHGNPGASNGMFGKSHTDEAKKKISDANIGKVRRIGFKLSPEQIKALSDCAKLRTGEKNPFFGKTHSQETKKILSEARKGKTPANAKPICINGTTYSSYHDASSKLDIPVVTIRWRVLSENPKYTEWKFA